MTTNNLQDVSNSLSLSLSGESLEQNITELNGIRSNLIDAISATADKFQISSKLVGLNDNSPLNDLPKYINSIENNVSGIIGNINRIFYVQRDYIPKPYFSRYTLYSNRPAYWCTYTIPYDMIAIISMVAGHWSWLAYKDSLNNYKEVEWGADGYLIKQYPMGTKLSAGIGGGCDWWANTSIYGIPISL